MTVSAVVLALSLTVPAGVPMFEDYPAEAALDGTPAAPKLDTTQAKLYRSQIRRAAEAGVTFNGHYTIANWGCGTNCMDWAVVDLRSGKVWMGPRQICVVPRLHQHRTPRWIDTSPRSALFFIYPCQLDASCAAQHMIRQQAWVWENASAHALTADCVSE
jgi:hypothetical protein